MLKKFLFGLVHGLQLGCLGAIYLLSDLYANHLGFMRNVSFYQAEFLQSPGAKCLLPLSLIFVVVAVWFFVRRKKFETGLFVIVTLVFSSWQIFFSLETQPIYYLISACLFVVCLLQFWLAFASRKEHHR